MSDFALSTPVQKSLECRRISFESWMSGHTLVHEPNMARSVRIARDPIDKLYRLSVRDIIGVVCVKDINEAAKIWRGIADEYKLTLSPFLASGQFAGKGQQIQPLLTLTGVLRLLMVLPGENARRNRLRFVDAIMRHLASDGNGLAPAFQLDLAQQALVQQMASDDINRDVETQRKRVRLPAEGDAGSSDDTPEDALALINEALVGEFNQVSLRWEAEEKEAIAAAVDGRVFGYCYLAWNPCFPVSLHKIGATTRTPQTRLNELSRTSVPEPFQLVASFACWNPFDVEKRIHRLFATARKYGRRNEFFDAPRPALEEAFNRMAYEALSGGGCDGHAKKKKKRAGASTSSVHDELAALRAEMSASRAETMGAIAGLKASFFASSSSSSAALP